MIRTIVREVRVIYQLSSTVIYYQPTVIFAISIIGQCLNFMAQLILDFTDSLNIFVEYKEILPSKLQGFGVSICFHCHVITIQVFLIQEISKVTTSKCS